MPGLTNAAEGVGTVMVEAGPQGEEDLELDMQTAMMQACEELKAAAYQEWEDCEMQFAMGNVRGGDHWNSARVELCGILMVGLARGKLCSFTWVQENVLILRCMAFERVERHVRLICSETAEDRTVSRVDH